MNKKVFFSSVLFMEIKLGLHIIHLKPRSSLYNGLHNFILNQKVQNLDFSQKNHGISLLGTQRHNIDKIFASEGDHQCNKIVHDTKQEF